MEKRCLCGLACARPFLFWLQTTFKTSLLLFVSGLAAFGWKMECNPLPPCRLPRAENWMDTSQMPSSPSFRGEETGSQRY
ncbi:hypothetical protein CapIbe_011279 [Capra ibex]